MKLKPSLTLDAASAILDSALAYSRAENMLPMTVVILELFLFFHYQSYKNFHRNNR